MTDSITQAEAARLIGVTATRVNHLIKEGKLHAIIRQVGRVTLDRAEVEAFVRERQATGREPMIRCSICGALEPHRIWKALWPDKFDAFPPPCGHKWWQYIASVPPISDEQVS